MGDRANVQITSGDESDDADIFLYTHWTGSALGSTLAAALVRGESRWNDRGYLTRIIFCEMIQYTVLDTTGFGIAPYECDSGPLYVVNIKEGTVEFYDHQTEPRGPLSFKDFIGYIEERDTLGAKYG